MKKDMESLREWGVLVLQAENEWQKLRYHLERRCKEEIRLFEGLGACVSFTYPEIKFYVSSYKGLNFLAGGGWGRVDTEDQGFGLPVGEGPMPWAEFEEKVRELAQKFGCPVEFAFLKVREEGSFDNISALRLLHPGVTVSLLDKGDVYYKGWDIPDRWYTAKIGEETWAFWSTDGHGGGISRYAKKGTPEWEKFEAFLDEDEDEYED